MSTLSDTLPADPMPNRVPASTTKAETMNDEHWTPNKDYHLQATWPPYTHPLSSLFHNARLQWPTNMDSRFQYERLVDWLATHLPASPEGREAEKGEAERRVKPLVWREWPGGVSYTSDSGIGEYVVEIGKDGEWCANRPAEETPFSSCDTFDAAKAAAQADFERRVLACLHPAPATLADETLRAENERLRGALFEVRDAITDPVNSQSIVCTVWMPVGSETMVDFIDHALGVEAAEAKLAARSQPAPVVEDGTAREEPFVYLREHDLREVAVPASSSRDTRVYRVPEHDGEKLFPLYARLAPEGQNAEASLREELACALEELIDHNGDDLNDTRAKRVAELRAAPTPASAEPAASVPGEVERLTRERNSAETEAIKRLAEAQDYRFRAEAAEAERDDLVLRCAVLDEALTNKLALASASVPGEVEPDSEKADRWPSAKKALWRVVTGENLNDGHYINAYRLTDKLYEALASASVPMDKASDGRQAEEVERLRVLIQTLANLSWPNSTAVKVANEALEALAALTPEASK